MYYKILWKVFIFYLRRKQPSKDIRVHEVDICNVDLMPLF